MKTTKLIGAALLIALSSMIYSCKKDKEETPAPTDDSKAITSDASDEGDVQSTDDEISDDVNIAIDNTSGAGRFASAGPCNGTAVFDTLTNKITITYDGTPCIANGKTKRGTIVISLLKEESWAIAGAILSIDVDLTVIKNGKTVEITGNKTITNITGGKLKDLETAIAGTVITHSTRASFNIKFLPSTDQRSWKVARRINFSMNDGDKYIEVMGDTTIDGTDGIVMWGKNRNGVDFKNIIISTLKANSACGWGKPTAGIRKHVGGKTFTVTFGVEASGDIYAGSALCGAYGFKAEWVNSAGEDKSIVIAY